MQLFTFLSTTLKGDSSNFKQMKWVSKVCILMDGKGYYLFME